MTAHPLQRRVGEDDIEWRSGCQSPMSPSVNVTSGGLEGAGSFEHRVRRVDPERCRRPQLAMQDGGEHPRSAAEIDHPAGRPFRDQRDQVVEGLLALSAKTLVWLGFHVLRTVTLLERRRRPAS